MIRGVDRTAIFLDDTDRARFVDRLRQLRPEEGARLFAWALMPNHVHLVAQSGPAGISRLMARLGTTHAAAFNRRHGRVGHLFQDRFKSVPVESDSHLRWLVRYVHRNPIEAGRIASIGELDRDPWTGHHELVSEPPAPLVATGHVLSWFAPGRAEAVRALRAWMEDGGRSEAPPAEALADPEVLQRFVGAAVARAAAARGVAPADVWRGSRRRAACEARALAIWELYGRLGLPAARIERALGLSAGAATRALRRADRLVRDQNRPLRQGAGRWYQATSQ